MTNKEWLKNELSLNNDYLSKTHIIMLNKILQDLEKVEKLEKLEKENKELKNILQKLAINVCKLKSILKKLEVLEDDNS